MNRYKLIEGDHGMGGMGDYKQREIAYFTSLGKAIDFMRKIGAIVDYDNKEKDFDLGQTYYIKDKTRGLGTMDYRVEPLSGSGIQIDPVTLEQCRGR